jgi:hypothetical protein
MSATGSRCGASRAATRWRAGPDGVPRTTELSPGQGARPGLPRRGRHIAAVTTRRAGWQSIAGSSPRTVIRCPTGRHASAVGTMYCGGWGPASGKHSSGRASWSLGAPACHEHVGEPLAQPGFRSGVGGNKPGHLEQAQDPGALLGQDAASGEPASQPAARRLQRAGSRPIQSLASRR